MRCAMGSRKDGSLEPKGMMDGCQLKQVPAPVLLIDYSGSAFVTSLACAPPGKLVLMKVAPEAERKTKAEVRRSFADTNIK